MYDAEGTASSRAAGKASSPSSPAAPSGAQCAAAWVVCSSCGTSMVVHGASVDARTGVQGIIVPLLFWGEMSTRE